MRGDNLRKRDSFQPLVDVLLQLRRIAVVVVRNETLKTILGSKQIIDFAGLSQTGLNVGQCVLSVGPRRRNQQWPWRDQP